MRSNSIFRSLALIYVGMCLTVDVCVAQPPCSGGGCGKTFCVFTDLECLNSALSNEYSPSTPIMGLCTLEGYDQGGSPYGEQPVTTVRCYDAVCTLLEIGRAHV